MLKTLFKKKNQNRTQPLAFFLVSFLIWSVGFSVPFVFDVDYKPAIDHGSSQELFQKLFDYKTQENQEMIFLTLLKNNLTVCVVNILGGYLMGFITAINLLINGYVAALSMRWYLDVGLSPSQLARYILPHSFELLGIWLAGAIGLSIGYQLWRMVFRGQEFSIHKKPILLLMALSFFIILLSSFVETYITPHV